MSPDRLDIQFAANECARNIATPREGHWTALTRIGRYLRGKPRMIMRYEYQGECATITTLTDSDWAGCKRTAKSTSGGIVTMGGHTTKT